MNSCRSRLGRQRDSEARVTPGSRKALVAGGQAEAQLLRRIPAASCPPLTNPCRHQRVTAGSCDQRPSARGSSGVTVQGAL